MAQANSYFTDVLNKVKDLDEFKLDTPVNKAVLSDIETLLTLESERQGQLEQIFSVIVSKVMTVCLNLNKNP